MKQLAPRWTPETRARSIMNGPAHEPKAAAPPLPTRLISIDAYRGFVMFLMMAEVLQFGAVAKAHAGSAFWNFLAWHQTHVEWVGCTLHDMIQPSFSFLVGVALPFSLAARSGRGESKRKMTWHAFQRAFILVALGVLLRSVGKPQTFYTFEDTLSQIGLGYVFLFLLGMRPVRDQWLAFLVIVIGYWAAFVVYTPGPEHDPSKLAAGSNWPHHVTGFAAHWDKNANLAWAFDVWFLNLFPRSARFTHNSGGYATLSFIPTLATMILGLIAGGILRQGGPPRDKFGHLLARAVPLVLIGWGLGALGVCPVVKRIWTPSWVLFSGGICFAMMAAWYAVVDLANYKRWAFPLVVIGMNSIAAYCFAHLFEDFLKSGFRTHLGRDVFLIWGPGYRPLLEGAAVLLALWLILYWMYRRRIFLRI
jgi:heparan-alpha-glucosaminide N-acetyltransferase